MKKVLLVGQFNSVMKDVYRHLSRSSKFVVQVCPDQKEIMAEIMDITEPELVVISLMGLDASHNNLFTCLKDDFPNARVLCYGTVSEQMVFFQYLGDSYCKMVTRTASHKELADKIAEYLDCGSETEIPTAYVSPAGNKMDDLNEMLQQVKNEQSDSKRKKKILLVDDKAIQLRTLRSLLVNDYDILLATSGSDALKIMQKSNPDLVFLDYEMPEMDGKDVLQRIREIEAIKDIPVVFLTGEKDKDRFMEVVKLNPAGYLLKPPNINKIHAIIEEVLGS